MVGRPAVPEVIWARPERAGRGPKPAFSRADIAAAAVRIADAEGLDAVSMRKVAAELGCGTMSLYNYVPRKEDLYELMFDAVSAGYDLPEKPSGDWRADILALAHQARAMMHRHTWVPRLMSPVYGFSPNALAYLEYALSCLDGFDARFGEKMELIAMVNGVITTYVANEIATAERGRSLPWSPEQEQEIRTRYLMSQIATGRYPRMAAGFAEDPGPIDLEGVFDRALGRVLDSFDR
ncbi:MULTISPECIES: TetR/AcrR family transcriptional regulator [Streptomyces]|uniref:AcrR family transcriptional regulator n=1 Tax=Streptomyces clavifer TaxID=68188 RepID=A0ABS4VEA4_9ACTN|nr:MULTISPECIES: TetR/AcrR family transcriptional regulator C-terminal domain-containing protein [Streptomyces]KQX89911.1 TetR family transcriptional regulator [Streptomyces sp. Root1319]KQZ20389.1 TetR family transcriptional regulator [Streptomyces sp. Root55]MBP2362253.1 AcrR family transcriptional regulator [Streptomyces clavifer]MDX2747457.1 TetR/AcrR family transcriptional regulator C-terminal domain-containing protein [Streptomyces sp. NRRL_B-2557]MDX3062885.1 TetR/AcrR family transcript